MSKIKDLSISDLQQLRAFVLDELTGWDGREGTDRIVSDDNYDTLSNLADSLRRELVFRTVNLLNEETEGGWEFKDFKVTQDQQQTHEAVAEALYAKYNLTKAEAAKLKEQYVLDETGTVALPEFMAEEDPRWIAWEANRLFEYHRHQSMIEDVRRKYQSYRVFKHD